MAVFLLLPNKKVMVHLADVLNILYNAYIYLQGHTCLSKPYLPYGSFQSP